MMVVEVALWGLFMGTSVFGHVALKRATNPLAHLKGQDFWLKLVEQPWAILAMLSWGASGVLWVWLLKRSNLLSATSVSTLRYVLIAAAAVWFLNEPFGSKQLAGVVFIGVGIVLIKSGPG